MKGGVSAEMPTTLAVDDTQERRWRLLLPEEAGGLPLLD